MDDLGQLFETMAQAGSLTGGGFQQNLDVKFWAMQVDFIQRPRHPD